MVEISTTKHSFMMCLDEGFMREKKRRIYFSFLNYGHYTFLKS